MVEIISSYCSVELESSELKVAGTEDSMIGFPEVSIGIIPGAGGTQRLPKIIGLSSAKYWIYTAKKFNGIDSMKYGFLNFVVKKNSFLRVPGGRIQRMRT